MSSTPRHTVPRGNYGYDAPYALIAFSAAGAGCLVGALGAWWTARFHLASIFGLYSGFFLVNASSFWYTTRHGKFVVWREIIERLRLCGDERVLDIGCGRGAVLTAVATRLTNGRVFGIDLWSTHDQSGNAAEVTLRNVAVEGVGDRIRIVTADMRALPFTDGSFDLVVSSLAIHNISSGAGRSQAIREAWRVLAPGGRLAVADIRATSRYARELKTLGAGGVTRRTLGWRFWYGNPMAATSLVMAQKPQTT
jgi:arsenite methyltransferase